MALVMSISVSAFAASITINRDQTYEEGTSGARTYTAYKVFDAIYDTDDPLSGSNTQDNKDPMNYQFFNSVGQSQFYGKYDLRVANMPYIVNIGNYRRQYKYTETNFFKFDEHLFSRWKEKESLPWGNALL